MTARIATIVLYTNPELILSRFSYSRDVKAVCTLNDVIEAFTVSEEVPLIGTPRYIMRCNLPSIKTRKPAGRAEFNTLDEALDYGKNLLRGIFPAVEGTLK